MTTRTQEDLDRTLASMRARGVSEETISALKSSSISQAARLAMLLCVGQIHQLGGPSPRLPREQVLDIVNAGLDLLLSSVLTDRLELIYTFAMDDKQRPSGLSPGDAALMLVAHLHDDIAKTLPPLGEKYSNLAEQLFLKGKDSDGKEDNTTTPETRNPASPTNRAHSSRWGSGGIPVSSNPESSDKDIADRNQPPERTPGLGSKS